MKIRLGLSVGIFALLFCHLIIGDAMAQRPRVSPAASASQKIGDLTEVVVTYSRPGVKGREIWGKLEPYDKVWRTGANEATTISFSKDVKINGQSLAAGKYGLFTIPSKSEWTVIFNKTHEQWGAFDYDAGQDALRIKAKAEMADHTERLSFSFRDLNANSAKVVMRWAKLAVPFTVEVLEVAEKARPSQAASAALTLGKDTRVTVAYSRPGVKGRKVWGGLVPYDKVWRAGANENTKITFSSAVMVNGKELAAGTYGLHTLPGADEWTIMFSKNSEAWGSFSYNQDEDALRLMVKPVATSEHAEWLNYGFTSLASRSNGEINKAQLGLHWEKLIIPIEVMVK